MTTAEPDPLFAPAEILNSWKEIATYLSRGVRTVQRWEMDLALPIRRPRGKNRSAVLAVRSEIDRWIKSCSLAGGTESPQPYKKYSLHASAVELHRLRIEMKDTRKQFSSALGNLIATLEKMRDDSNADASATGLNIRRQALRSTTAA